MSPTDATRADPLRVFLSYSRHDETAVIQLAQALEADGTIDVFRDKEDILPAEDWSERLGSLIRQAHAFILCLSPDAARSREVGREIDEALNAHKRIVPLILRATPDDQIRDAIRRLNFIFLRPEDAFEAALSKLRDAVRTDITAVRDHTRLGELAQRWNSDGRRASDLLRGPALELAERWLASREGPEPTALHVDFITASRRGATRRLRGWAAGGVSVALLTAALALVALAQRNEARAQRTAAQARRLVAEAQTALADAKSSGQQPAQQLLVSLALHPSEEARQALARATSRLEPVRVAELSWPDGGELRDLRFTPSGGRLLAVTDRSISAWSSTGRLEWQRPAALEVGETRTLFAPDGERALVLVGGRDAPELHVTLVDLTAGTLASTAAGLGRVLDAGPVGARLLVLAEKEGELAACDPQTGEATWHSMVAGPVQGARVVRPTDPGGEGPSADVVAVDAGNRVRLWRLDGREVPAAPLPAGSRLLLIGERARALAVRRADGQHAVLDTVRGRELWSGAADGAVPVALVGGDRFVLAQGRHGITLQSLGGGFAAQIEPTRSTDWDLSALSDVQRYSAIVDTAVSDDGATLATAWNDGRVDVWYPGTKPRYGAIGGMPMPSFELAARFDHGETLGATVGWTSPASLTLSPSGRFVASQSLGITTNAVGGVTSASPKLRVWDTRARGEVARFARERPMGIAFSPRDDLAVTVMAAANDSAPASLELWRLSPGPADVVRDELSLPLPLRKGSDAGPASKPSPQALLAPQSGSSDRVWIGVDLQLHALDRQQRRVRVLDDLAPAFEEARARARQAAANLAARQDLSDAERQALRQISSLADAPALPSKLDVEIPALPLPIAAIAVSGDGRRCAVMIGAQLRLYALDEQRLLAAFDCGEGGDLLGVLDPSGELTRQSPVLSPDGRFAGIYRFDALALLRAVLSAATPSPTAQTVAREIAVMALDGVAPSATPIASWISEVQVGPLQTPLGLITTASRLLALSTDGKLLALEKRELLPAGAQPPRREARLMVIEAGTGRIVLERPPVTQPSPLDFAEQALAVPWAATFSPSGHRLVSEDTHSPCPLKLETNPLTWMPSKRPSCPELATQLTWWDLDRGTVLGSASYERIAPTQQALLTPMAPPRRPASLAMPNENEVLRNVVEWTAPTPCSAVPCAQIHSTEERISLDLRDHLVEEACARLPAALRTLPADQWRERLPGEASRAICAEP